MSEKESSSKGCLIGIVLLVVIIGAAVIANVASNGSGGSDPEFGPQESARLADRLAAATQVQRICYGWEVDADTGSAVQIGSNLGAGVDPRKDPRCARWAVLTADYYYSISDDEWTSVTTRVQTNLPVSVTDIDLDTAGITGKDLLGNDAGERLADAIGALPMIVAEKGGAPAVPETTAQTPPTGDKVSAPSRTRYVWMGVAALLIIGGLVWIAVAAVRSSRQQGSALR